MRIECRQKAEWAMQGRNPGSVAGGGSQHSGRQSLRDMVRPMDEVRSNAPPPPSVRPSCNPSPVPPLPSTTPLLYSCSKARGRGAEHGGRARHDRVAGHGAGGHRYYKIWKLCI